MFTIEGWHEIPDQIVMAQSGVWWNVGVRLFFSLAVLSCGILGLSIANAVFVDEMVMDNNQALEQKVEQLTCEIRAMRDEMKASRPAGSDSSKSG